MNEMMNSYLQLDLYTDVIPSLQNLSPCKFAILTNGNTEMIDKLTVNTGLTEYIDKIISVNDVKLFKPRSEVYKLALDNLEVDKNEILFLSSNAWDVAGAKSFGFTVGWINRFNKPNEKLGFQPDYIVSNLLELSKAIKK